ncbi:MAG: MarR family winged helix-turn-helix transcriptional regulator [Patescibacteria group bacterium]
MNSRQDQRIIWLFARAVDLLLAAAPGDLSLSPVQYFTLRFIGLHEEPTPGALAEALNVSNAAATKLIDRLVRKGLVGRTAGTADRREKKLTLTREGERLLAAADAGREEALGRVLARLTEREREDLHRALDSFLAAALHDPGALKKICLYCGRLHEPACPGEQLYRRLGGPPRQV